MAEHFTRAPKSFGPQGLWWCETWPSFRAFLPLCFVCVWAKIKGNYPPPQAGIKLFNPTSALCRTLEPEPENDQIITPPQTWNFEPSNSPNSDSKKNPVCNRRWFPATVWGLNRIIPAYTHPHTLSDAKSTQTGCTGPCRHGQARASWLLKKKWCGGKPANHITACKLMERKKGCE